MEKAVARSVDEQVVHLEARIAALEEILFETNKPLVKYGVDPMGDTLIFNFSELSPEDSKKIAQTIVAQEEEADICEEELLLLIQSAQSEKLGFKPRL